MALKLQRVALPCLCALLCCGGALAATSTEERSLTELRNTVVNLLQTLVEKGVLSREQAEAMVRNAQSKAETEAAAKAAQQQQLEKEEASAVRVPYVPQIVKDEISKEVVAELSPSVAQEVVAKVRTDKSLRAALPDWVDRIDWSGDLRVRGERILYSPDNAKNTYLDFQTINNRGGIGKAGAAALLNTSVDRDRLRVRLRFGFDANLGSGWSAVARLATGSLNDPVSTNQTLGVYSGRYQIGVDQAFLRWNGETHSRQHELTLLAGRIPNPWFGTEMVWDPDLMFEGVTTNYRWNFARAYGDRSNLYMTLGAFPVQEIELSYKDKWLLGGQVGFDVQTRNLGQYRLGMAYYSYKNIAGRRNVLNSNLLDYTAPLWMQKGNTLFDIRNGTDPSSSLFALAADYKLLDATASADWRVAGGYRWSLVADYVKNIGYKQADVLALTGQRVPPRNKGYDVELGFGSDELARARAWRVGIAYRYLQRDAVLDAFTDSDFHFGGTDAKGYVASVDFAPTARVWVRLRYLSANEIDGPPLGIDVWQLDLNTRF